MWLCVAASLGVCLCCHLGCLHVLFLIGTCMGRRGWSRVKQVNHHVIRDSESNKDEEKVKLVNISKGHTTVFNTGSFILAKNKSGKQIYSPK